MRTGLWRGVTPVLFLHGAARALERTEAALGMSVAVLQGTLTGDSCGHALRGVAPLRKEGFETPVIMGGGPVPHARASLKAVCVLAGSSSMARSAS